MPPITYDVARSEAQVRVGLSLDPPRQARWSVLLRAIMAIPLFVVAEFVGIASVFVMIVAWFAAIFTGRVPEGMQRFLTNALRLYANLLAYSYLLVPRWPGLNFHSRPTEQVTVDVDHARLRRWAVFFRLILGYPANVVSVVFTSGSIPVLVVMWFWGIVAGREPRPLHQALALVLRFQLRLQAYACLITPTQPFRGIFGDGAAAKLPAASVTSDSATASGDSADSINVRATEALPTRWFVAKITRVVLVVILLIGAPIYALNFFIERPLLTRFQSEISRTIVTSSYHTTVDAIVQFEASVARCHAPTYSGCTARAATLARLQMAPSLATMSYNALVPPDALSRMLVYESAFDSLERELKAVQLSTSASAQRAIIKEDVPNTFSNFGAAYQRVIATLDD